MKMIITIIKDNDTDALIKALTSDGFRVTTIASTGGFLRSGVSTLLCGVEDDQVKKAIDVIHKVFPPHPETPERRCTLFVLNVADSQHF
jgi:uncharacterized protein YaaQ